MAGGLPTDESPGIQAPPPHNTYIHTPGRQSRLSYLVPGKLYMYMALAFIRRLTAGSDG